MWRAHPGRLLRLWRQHRLVERLLSVQEPGLRQLVRHRRARDGDVLAGGPDLLPVFEGMAMGWSWALWTCNAITTAAGGRPGRDLVVRDRIPTITPTDEEALRSPYIDNGSVIGITQRSVERTFERVLGDLERAGLVVHERVDVTENQSMVGIVLDGPRRTLSHTPRRVWRVWRLHLALRALLVRSRLSAKSLEIPVGHIVHAFELLRPALSIPMRASNANNIARSDSAIYNVF